MHLETQRLIIRDFRAGDAPDLQEILGDGEVMAHAEPPYTPARTEAFLRDFCMARHGALAAECRATGRVIGYILFHETERDVYEMGWFFSRRVWRQGYAYEACRAVLDAAFDDLHAHRVFAETTDGVKSAGLMRKLGMRPEGVMRLHTREPDGRWADLHLYGLLARERTEPAENSAIRR
ncbi:MAG: GNAT family N-acetyltransferase [Aristaeellaceae bacterium]